VGRGDRRDAAGQAPGDGADDRRAPEPIEVELLPEDESEDEPRAGSGPETVGGGGRDRLAEFFQRPADRLAGLPMRARIASAAAVVVALALLLSLQISKAPTPPAPLQLRLTGASFAPSREGNGLTLSVVLTNDATTSALLYTSSIAIDGLQTGTTRGTPLGTVPGDGAVFTYGFAMSFDCAVTAGGVPRLTPRADRSQLVVFAAGPDGVRRELDIPFPYNPWADYNQARGNYCSNGTPHDVVITYEGNRAPADTTAHSFRIVLGVKNNSTTRRVRIDNVTQPSNSLALAPENIPTSVAPGNSGILLVTVLVENCDVAPRGLGTPYAQVYFSDDRGGPYVAEVPLPADAMASQIREACGGS
jgi:hypothetical protein